MRLRVKNVIAQFKLLPKQTKLLFSIGMLLAFLVALPLSVYMITTQIVDIRGRASGISEGEELILSSPTPTLAPTLELPSGPKPSIIPYVAIGGIAVSLILIFIGIKKSRSVLK